MMSAAPILQLQLILCLCLCLCICSMCSLHSLNSITGAEGLSLVFNYSQNKGAAASFLQMQSATVRNSSGAYWLTPDPDEMLPSKRSNVQGRLLYMHPLQFKASDDIGHNVSSFSTSFSFQINTPGNYGYCGDGLAFFIAPTDEMPLASGGGYMGVIANDSLINPTERHLFAVEFDTFQNEDLNDSSSSHIGININGMVSLDVNDTAGSAPENLDGPHPELFLYSNHTFTAWVEYDALTQYITVWASRSLADRPSQPCLHVPYDLSTVLKRDMYIGLSAASGDANEGHVVYSWDFSIETIYPPAPAPAPSQRGPSPVQSLPAGSTHRKGHTSWVVALVCIVLVFAFALLCLVIVLRRRLKGGPIQFLPSRRPPQAATDACIASSLGISAPHCSFRALERATNGFSDKNKIGEGAYGEVYRGTFPDGSPVAIKKLKDDRPKKREEFLTEIGIISKISHRNLLQLKGYCYERGQALLVYDYMPNGSLENYIFDHRIRSNSCGEQAERVRNCLNSDTKFEILKGVASALEYLHRELGLCVLHRDVKAANVMLTERFEPMLGDFGLARLVPHDKVTTMTAVAGTPGYIAPEVWVTRKATDKSDVYSFGLLALEVACGRRALNACLPPDQIFLVDWVWQLKQSNILMDALDPALRLEEMDSRLAQEGDTISGLDKWRCVLHVGLKSCLPSPESRPSMRQIYQALEETLILPLPSSQPDLYPPTSRTEASYVQE